MKRKALRSTTSRLATVLAAVALSVGFAAPAAAQLPPLPPLPPVQDGLVNVVISGNTIQVPISVAANICDINVAILAVQERGDGAECTATAESIASPGQSGNNGGGGAQQGGLVNVDISGNTIQLPVSVAANLCDVNVAALLAEQRRGGGANCTATAESIASPGKSGNRQ
jgi:hypothetical protein